MVQAVRRIELTDEQVRREAEILLSDRLAPFGFRAVDARSETDFDGEPILSVTAMLDTRPKAEVMIDVWSDLRTKLLELGEERFVFFKGLTDAPGPVDEDEEG